VFPEQYDNETSGMPMKASAKKDTASPLKKDIRFLTTLLGDVIQEQDGEGIYLKIEEIRELAKKIRKHPSSKLASKQEGIIHSLNLDEAYKVARAFTIYFQLVNIAEEAHRIRRIRAYDGDPAALQKMSLRRLFHDLKHQGIPAKRVAQFFFQMEISPVLTAHPTEARRRSVLNHLLTIASLLTQRNKQDTTETEQDTIDQRLKVFLEILWQTSELRQRKVNVLDEVDQTLFYFKRTIIDLVPGIQKKLQLEFRRFYGGNKSFKRSLIHFGSWVGSDRDGNDFVTCGVSKETATHHWKAILHFYLSAIENLIVQLSHSHRITPVSDELFHSLANDKRQLSDFAKKLKHFEPSEVYRQKLSFIHRKLENRANRRSGAYESANEFLSDLSLVRQSLKKNNGQSAARGDIEKLIYQVECFGFHLAKLDFRDHATKVRRAVAELFPGQAIDEAFLIKQILTSVSLKTKGRLTTPSQDVMNQLATIKEIQDKLDSKLAENYILSMTENPCDMLSLFYLAKIKGLIQLRAGNVRESRVRIVPLFETIGALAKADEVMDRLFSLPVYRSYLKSKDNLQEIMLGYSDSCKDGSYVTANWKLCLAQKKLVDVAARHDVRLRFFHGKGGTIDRGGGESHGALLAQPNAAPCGLIKITEQGEVVSQKYANAVIAGRNLEELISAVALSNLVPNESLSENSKTRAWGKRIEILSESSYHYYRSLVSETPGFMDFYNEATPIQLIKMARIGSRPSARTRGENFKDLRAIPWVFSWLQSRFVISAWYGLGHALESFISQRSGGLEELREMNRDWPFFRMLMRNAQISLAKTDLFIAENYARLVRDPTHRKILFEKIAAEYHRATARVLEVCEQEELLDFHPVLKTSIRLRNPYVDPLNYIQCRFLEERRQWTKKTSRDTRERIDEILLLTINGIAFGMKSTG
jgi:phosphoenolpyruvate carboxylase